jgi:hypothetical protein
MGWRPSSLSLLRRRKASTPGGSGCGLKTKLATITLWRAKNGDLHHQPRFLRHITTLLSALALPSSVPPPAPLTNAVAVDVLVLSGPQRPCLLLPIPLLLCCCYLVRRFSVCAAGFSMLRRPCCCPPAFTAPSPPTPVP